MQKLLIGLLVIGSTTAFANDPSVKCDSFLRTAVAQDILCSKQMNAIESSQDDDELKLAEGRFQVCFDISKSICLVSLKSSDESVIRSLYFERQTIALETVCQKEMDAIGESRSEENWQALDGCLAKLRALYLKNL